MATIITLHGTSDTGPDTGDKWWQRGGEFESDLQALVAAEQGDLRFEPFVWSGANSETERYRAGGALVDKLAELEAAQEPYCLVGHSHGGSTIDQALAIAEERGVALNHLRRWITVGTPFIALKRRALLFSRLSTRGVAVYLIVFYLFIMWLAFLASCAFLIYEALTRGGPGLQNPVFDLPFLVASAVVLLGLYVMLRRLQPRKLRAANARLRARLAQKFGPRLIALWHRDDEVINGGRLLKDIRFRPFTPEFAAPPLAFLSLLLIPVGMAAFANPALWVELSDRINDWTPFVPAPSCEAPGASAADCADPFKSFARDSLAIVGLPAIGLFELLRLIELSPGDSAGTNAAVAIATLVVGGLMGVGAIWLLGLLVHRLVLWAAHFISLALAGALNAMTRAQLVALGYGGDSHGEIAVDATPQPAWMASPLPSLPPALEQEISASSDRAAAVALARIRAALSTLSLEGDQNPADLLSRHVTWSELIHCNYFRVARMRKLIAYCVAQQPGFKPTEALRNDSDVALLGQWRAHVETASAPPAP